MRFRALFVPVDPAGEDHPCLAAKETHADALIYHLQDFFVYCCFMKQDSVKRDITAAILAGGRNKRFQGKTKAKITIEGKTIIERSLETLGSVFDDIIIITNNKDEFREYGHIRMAGDIYHNTGPLGGLHSALTNTRAKAVFMVAADMPQLSAPLIERQADEFFSSDCDVLLPEWEGHIEPLHGIYSSSVLAKLEEYLGRESKYAIRDFLSLVSVQYFNCGDMAKQNVFININTREDLDNYLAGNA